MTEENAVGDICYCMIRTKRQPCRVGGQSVIRWLAHLMIMWPLLFQVTCVGTKLQAQSTASAVATPFETEVPAHAVIANATYRATLRNGDLANGELSWELVHRGTGPAVLDLTFAEVAIHDLRSNEQELVWGTDTEQRTLAVVDRDVSTVSGRWSAYGRTLEGVSFLTVHLPRAVNSQLELTLPAAFNLRSTVGLVETLEPQDTHGHRVWRVHLGRHHDTTLIVEPERLPVDPARSKVSVEAIYVARQDGFFVQSDFTVETRSQPALEELEVVIPRSLQVRAVTWGGVQIPFSSAANGTLRVQLPGSGRRGRATLRVQGFQAARWVRPQTLPRMHLLSSLESSRRISVRVESPLELHDLQTQGCVQTAFLTESRGEVWQFEAYDRDARVVVDLGFPIQDLRARIHTLYQLHSFSPTATTLIDVAAERSQQFEMDVLLPDGWIVTSVASRNAETRISGWTLNGNRLQVTFKDPLSSVREKSVVIESRASALRSAEQRTLPIPVLPHAVTTSIRCDWLLSADERLELTNATFWSKLTSTIDVQAFPGGPDVVDPATMSQHSYFNPTANINSLPAYRIVQALPEPADSLDDELTEFVSSSSADPSSSGTRQAMVELVTRGDALDHSGNPQLLHHLTIVTPQQMDPHEFEVDLPSGCLLSAVFIEDQSIRVEQNGERLILPSDLDSFSRATLVYLTPVETQLLRQECRIPVPRLSLDVLDFQWTLEIPDSRKLAQISFPELSTSRLLSSSFWGIFSRRSDSRVPAQLPDGLEPAVVRDHVHGERSRVIELRGAALAEEVGFVVWDTVGTNKVALVLCLCCLLVGVGTRLTRQTFLRFTVPCWLGMLILSQLVVTNEWSLLVGSMLTGTVISLLIPMRPFSQAATRSMKMSTVIVPASTALIVVTVSWSVLSGAPAMTAPNAPLPPPHVLLRSARYEFLESAAVESYHAKFEVLTAASQTGLHVSLPFQGVVFLNNAECLVDGVATHLIPSRAGDGVLVKIPEQLTESVDPGGQASPASRWETHVIELEFAMRTDQDAQVAVRIPRIVDATLRAPIDWPAVSIDRKGSLETERESRAIVAAIGPVTSVERRSDDSDEPMFRSSTSLVVTATALNGQLVLEPVSAELPEQLAVTIPDAAILTGVTGGLVSHWTQTQDALGDRRLVFNLNVDNKTSAIAVSYSLPSTVNTQGEVVIPPLPGSRSSSPGILGIRTISGLQLKLADGQPQIRKLPAEMWTRNEAANRSFPSIVVEQDVSQRIRVLLEPLDAAIDSTRSETLTVNRSTLDWRASIELDVQTRPVFVHHFQLHGNLRIRAARLDTPGEATPLRYFQSRRELKVFVPDGQLGPRKLTLEGDVLFASGTPHPIPGITAIESHRSTGSYEILDRTNWNLEVTYDDGTRSLHKADQLEQFEDERAISTIPADAMRRPQTVQLMPPASSVRVDVVTRLSVDEREAWNLIYLLHFSSDQVPIKSVSFQIPRELQGARIGPRYFRRQQSENGDWIDTNIQIPDRFSDQVTLQVFAPLPKNLETQLRSGTPELQSTELPQFRIQSARTGSQFLILNRRPESLQPLGAGKAIQRDHLPEWMPISWKQAIESEQCRAFQILEDEIALASTASRLSDQEPVFRYIESLLWYDSTGQLHGRTHLWAEDLSFRRLKLPFRSSVEPISVSVAGQTQLPVEVSADGAFVQLTHRTSNSMLSVRWQQSEVDEVPSTQQIPSPILPSETEVVHLIGLISPNHRDVEVIDDSQLSMPQVWLQRWESLMDFAEQLSGPLSFDSALYRSLRECQSVLQETLQFGNIGDVQEFARLQDRWKLLQEELSIAAEPVVQRAVGTANPEPAIVFSGNPFQQVVWTIREEHTDSSPVFTLRANSDEVHWLRAALLCVVTVGGTVLCYRTQTVMVRLTQQVEAIPALPLVGLSLLWAIFWQPMSVSLLILAMAVLIHCASDDAFKRRVLKAPERS